MRLENDKIESISRFIKIAMPSAPYAGCCTFIGGIYSSVMPGMPPKMFHRSGRATARERGGWGARVRRARDQNIPRAMNILKFSGPELRVQLCHKKAIVRGKIVRLLRPHIHT